ncbi:Heme-binding protein A [bacterium HR23]|nr:Heme-binding protein A [bacterium HR23]
MGRLQRCARFAVGGLALAGLVLLACARAQPTPALSPTPLPSPQATPLPAVTPSPTPLAVATPTSLPTPTPTVFLGGGALTPVAVVTPSTAALPDGEPPPNRRGGVLRGTWSGTLRHFDMHQVGELGTWNAVNLIYNPLFEWSALDRKQETIAPELAEAWEVSPDGTRYTFKLRQGVQFHDGTPVTVDDVVFSLNRVYGRNLPPGTVSARAEWFADMVDKVEALGPDRVVVTLRFPSANFMTLMAEGWHVIVPKHVVEKQGDLKTVAVGTGPFVFKSFVPNQSFEVTRNPNYWRQGLPYLDGVVLYNITDQTTVLGALLTKRLDMANPAGQNIEPRTAEELRRRNVPGMVVEENPRLGVYSILIQTTKKPLDDIRVRQAINEALNREEYQKFAKAIKFKIGGAVFPGSVWDLPQAEWEQLPGYGPNYEARLARAKQLLADAGLPGGGLTLEMTGSAGPACDDAQEAMRTMLARIGITVKPACTPTTDARVREEEGRFDLHYQGYGISSIDPAGVIGTHMVCGGGRNFSRMCSPRIDELYRQQISVLDLQERAKVVRELVKEVTRFSGMNIIGWYVEFFAKWGYVKNHIVTPSRYTAAAKLEWVWLDK